MNMKRTALMALAILISSIPHFTSSSLLFAQYRDYKEQVTKVNRPFNEIPSQGTGEGLLFNFDWRFQLGNPEGAEKEDFNDAGWRKLDLPHDFQFEQPWDQSAGGARGFKQRCEGWYRKTFDAPQEWQGLQVVLDFDGVMYYGDVYVNGTKVASSEYGYIGFETDISRHLHYGGKNVVAVYANSGKPNGSRWYTGAGLFRDIHLLLRNNTHVARHGIYVKSEVKGESASVQVQVDVDGFPHGSGEQPQTLVKATIKDKEGQSLGQAEAVMNTLTKHRHDEIALPVITLTKPMTVSWILFLTAAAGRLN